MTQVNSECSTSAPGVSPAAPSINATLEPFGGIGFQERPVYPAEVADALVVLRKARSDAADQIERLLSFLNETELDIEENEIDAIFRARFGDGLLEDDLDERELETEHDELTGDEEPSLGSSGNMNQSQWGANDSFTCDLELDTCDDEPSLSGVTVERGDDRDLEADLGSFDKMTDQRKALRTTSTHFAVQSGELDSAP